MNAVEKANARAAEILHYQHSRYANLVVNPKPSDTGCIARSIRNAERIAHAQKTANAHAAKVQISRRNTFVATALIWQMSNAVKGIRFASRKDFVRSVANNRQRKANHGKANPCDIAIAALISRSNTIKHIAIKSAKPSRTGRMRYSTKGCAWVVPNPLLRRERSANPPASHTPVAVRVQGS